MSEEEIKKECGAHYVKDGLAYTVQYDCQCEVIRLRAALAEKEAQAKGWRCFHCGEVFTVEQDAKDHFAIEGIPPMCVDPLTKDEKTRMVVVRKLEAELVKWRKENEELDHQAQSAHAMRVELGQFGMCGGVKVSSVQGAWLVHEAMIGAKEAATARAEAAEAMTFDARRDYEAEKLRAEKAEKEAQGLIAQRDDNARSRAYCREQEEIQRTRAEKAEALLAVVTGERNAFEKSAEQHGARVVELLKEAQALREERDGWKLTHSKAIAAQAQEIKALRSELELKRHELSAKGAALAECVKHRSAAYQAAENWEKLAKETCADVEKILATRTAAKDRLLAEQAAVIERAEKALQPFDLAHCSALAGDNPMRDITLHDLRFASETYHVLPDTQEKPK